MPSTVVPLGVIDKNSQVTVGEDEYCIDLICTLFDKLLEQPKIEENIVCLRVGCQFIGNLIVDNSANKLKIHNKCFTHIRKLMLLGDEKLSQFCAMILYNIILSQGEACQDILKKTDLVRAILNQNSEFSTFITETLLFKHGEIEALYSNCDLEARIMLLTMIRDQAMDDKNVPDTCITFIADRFKKQSDKILKIVSTYVESLDPQEICALLFTLASLSGSDTGPYLKTLQTDNSLFINCAFLLRSIHEAGKSGNNCFTSVRKLPDENSKSKENPVYGFKADLIRLIGNLCYGHDKNKNQVRELDSIPILLDCCNIDDSNPFILQWSILALKNISERCHENQAIIAGLAKKDVAFSPILEELGYTLHSEDGKGIRIAPLKR
ncbi:ataxin-10-like isoform X2 [Nilaparvata lugens]|uniref:ataxin-10-like isoform X2 n=1 Tax=Nilaparvata lugens TaxID=108931 RepID=UPI00193E74B3|nr:ataxin-10-like isoform X2 [Nilaparvata lugens]